MRYGGPAWSKTDRFSHGCTEVKCIWDENTKELLCMNKQRSCNLLGSAGFFFFFLRRHKREKTLQRRQRCYLNGRLCMLCRK